MASGNTLKRIAIIGGTGFLGKLILSSLLATKRFEVTAVTRDAKSDQLPKDDSLAIKGGSYDDAEFLVDALKGQDALIIVLNYQVQSEQHIFIVDAAAKAGVKWIVPCEFGSDNANVAQREQVPVSGSKTVVREHIEKVGCKWLGVATNPWFDYSLRGGYLGFDVKARKATIYNGGDIKFNTTNVRTVGKAVAALLSLPVTATGNEPTLTKFANNFVYISSHLITQNEILAALQRFTKTSPSDWEITQDSTERFMEEGRERFAKGDFYGIVNLVYGQLFLEGSGSNYEDTKGTTNEALGLPKESLDESVRGAFA